MWRSGAACDTICMSVRPFSRLLLLALLAPPGLAQGAEEEVPTDPAVIEKKVKEIEKEYDAL